MVNERDLDNKMWRHQLLKDITTKIGSGKTPLGGSSAYKLQGTALIRSQNIRNDAVDLSDVVFIDDATDQSMSNTFVFKNDVLLNITGASIGRSAVYKKDDHANVNQHVCIIRPKPSINPNFLQLLISSNAGQSQINAHQAGGGREGLNFKQIGNMSFEFPPLPEQECIAAVLSDVSQVIIDLEKLIEKKKSIKQGVMQELLTGNKRLPGYCGEIHYESLQSQCDLFCDGDWIESKDQSNEGIRLIQTGNIGQGVFLNRADKARYISSDTFTRLKCIEIFEGYVLVSRLPEPAGRACILPYMNKRMITAVDCTIIKFNRYNPYLFIAYSQTKQYQDQINASLAGSTRQRVSRKSLGNVMIPIFPSEEEQIAIAQVFRDIDTEIDALQSKLEKYRQLKIGMMQKLLTGEIRLV